MAILKDCIGILDFTRTVPDNATPKDVGDADAGSLLVEHGRAYAVYVRSRFRRAPLEVNTPAGSHRLEVFGGDGESTLTAPLEPRPAAQDLELYALGGEARLVRLDAWTLAPA